MSRSQIYDGAAWVDMTSVPEGVPGVQMNLRKSSNQTVDGAYTTTDITWQTETADPDDWFDSGSSTTTFSPNMSGYYHVHLHARWVSDTTQTAQITLSGATTGAILFVGLTAEKSIDLNGVVWLDADDDYKVGMYAFSSGAAIVGADDYHATNLIVTQLGGGLAGYPDTWLDALFTRPSDETVHVDDQEFNGTIGGTAVTPSGTAVWTQGKSLLSVVADDNTNNDGCFRLWPLTPTSAPVTIEVAMRIAGTDSSSNMGSLMFADGTTTTSNIDGMVYYLSTSNYGVVQAYGGTITALASLGSERTVGAGTRAEMLYMRAIWSAANTWTAQYSIDGVSWVTITKDAADTMTPTHFGVSGATWGGSMPMIATFEYLRVTESDLSV